MRSQHRGYWCPGATAPGHQQCSAKALEKWAQMTHTIEKYGNVGNFSGVTYVMLPFMNLKFVGTWAPTAKIIGDIPDFNVLNVPKTQPRHNPASVSTMLAKHSLYWTSFIYKCHTYGEQHYEIKLHFWKNMAQSFRGWKSNIWKHVLSGECHRSSLIMCIHWFR